MDRNRNRNRRRHTVGGELLREYPTKQDAAARSYFTHLGASFFILAAILKMHLFEPTSVISVLCRYRKKHSYKVFASLCNRQSNNWYMS
jgi:hypothetical protein